MPDQPKTETFVSPPSQASASDNADAPPERSEEDGAKDTEPMAPLINVPAKKPSKRGKRNQKSKRSAAESIEPAAQRPVLLHYAVPGQRDGPQPDSATEPQEQGADPDQTTEEESLEWRRKAHSRRLKALRKEREGTDTVAEEDYVPAFTARRIPDGAPEFDQPAEALAINPKPNPYGVNPGLAVSLLTAGCALAVVLVVWTVSLLGNAGETETMRKVTGGIPTKPEGVEEGDHRLAAKTAPEAIAVVKRFFEAGTPEEKAQFVRGGEAMLPYMQEYYSLHPQEPGAVILGNNVEFQSDGDRKFVQVTGSTATSVTFDTWVERTPSGPRLDWRFLTGRGEMEWSRWIKERPARPVTMRVVAGMDDYYAGQFSEREKWLCLKMTDIFLNATVWAYVERLNDTGLAVIEKLGGPGRTIRMTARFEFPAAPEGASAPVAGVPQVIIRSVQDNLWLDCSPEATGDPPATPPVSRNP